jgi:hypothetical protein
MSEPIPCEIFIDGKRLNRVEVLYWTDAGKYRYGVISNTGNRLSPPFSKRYPDDSDPAELVFDTGQKAIVTLIEIAPNGQGRLFISDKSDWPPLDKITPKKIQFP